MSAAWRDMAWYTVVAGATFALSYGLANPTHPQPRRAAKVAAWALATLAAGRFWLELYMVALLGALVATDVAYSVTKQRASTLVQLQISVPAAVLQDERYRVGIESFRRERLGLRDVAVEERKRLVASTSASAAHSAHGSSGLDVAEFVRRERTAADGGDPTRRATRGGGGSGSGGAQTTGFTGSLKRAGPVRGAVADDDAFAGVPSVWRFMWEFVVQYAREAQRAAPVRVLDLGVLGRAKPDLATAALWRELAPAGFGKAQHVRHEAWLFYRVLWSGGGGGGAEQHHAVSFRVDDAQLVRSGGFLYLRKRLPRGDGAYARQCEEDTAALQRIERAVARLLEPAGADAQDRLGESAMSVLAPAVFVATHDAAAAAASGVPETEAPSPRDLATCTSTPATAASSSVQMPSSPAPATAQTTQTPALPTAAPDERLAECKATGPRRELPLALRGGLTTGERYMWMQALADMTDTAFAGDWTTPSAWTVTASGVVYWSTAAAERSIRLAYSFGRV